MSEIQDEAVAIDLSLANESLYKGLEIGEAGGRKNLKTPASEATNIVGRNVREILNEIPVNKRDKVILTGPMAVWAYLIVFHAMVHAFREVYYCDGRNDPVLIAAHG